MKIKETILKSGKIKRTVIFAWKYQSFEDGKDFTTTLYRDGDYCFEVLTPKATIECSSPEKTLRKVKKKTIHRYYAVDDQQEYDTEKGMGKAIMERFR